MNSRDLQLESTKARPTDRAWPWVALLLTLALIGLAHDISNATALGMESAEAGGHVNRLAAFEADPTSVGLSRKIGFACFLLVGVYCAATIPRGHRVQWDGLSFLIVLSLLWVLSSVAWSIHSVQSIRELVRLVAFLFVAASLALRFDSRSLCLLLLTTLIASLSTSIGAELVTGGLRPWVSDYRLGGTMHSGTTGMYAMLIAIGAYGLAKLQKSTFWWGVVIAAGVALILSKALASLLACAVGISAIHLLSKSKRTLLFGTVAGMTLFGVFLFVTSATDFWSAFRTGSIDTLGRDYDFTSFNGRIPLWTLLCEKLEGRWLQGFGYAGFWVTKNIESMFDELGWYASHAHSGYLGTIVHVGLIGFGLVFSIAVMAFLRTVREARTTGQPEYCIFAAWLGVALFTSLAESAFIDPRDIGLLSAAVVFSCVVTTQPVAISSPANPMASTMPSPSTPRGGFA